MDCSLPGSSVHGISQASILECIAISFSRGSSWPRDRTHIFYSEVDSLPLSHLRRLSHFLENSILEKEMSTHSSVLAWWIPGMGGLVGCCLWGRTESDTTEATSQQQQQHPLVLLILQWKHEKWNKIYSCIGICANEGRKTCAWKMRSANVFLASD